jgi:Fe-S-cluster-containing dehydrogenase component/anaerobic selenocysteine-containing dehydrogenase
LCAGGQSSLQNLYDPDRVREPLKKKDGAFLADSWDATLAGVAEKLKTAKSVALLTGELNGSQLKFVSEWCAAVGAEHVAYDPLQPLALAKATESVFGVYGVPDYHFEEAGAVLNFGADFLETWVSPCGFARDWAKSRKGKTPCRVIHVEPRLSLTGANADKWVAAKPGSELAIAMAVLKLVAAQRTVPAAISGQLSALLTGVSVDAAALEADIAKAEILSMADALVSSKNSLVIAGGAAAASEDAYKLQVVVALLNLVLGNVGSTLKLDRVRKPISSLDKLQALIKKMSAGDVDALLVCGTNPAYSLPSSYGFKHAARSVRNSDKKQIDLLVLSSKLDETAKLSDVVLPIHTGLESWGDFEALSGIRSVLQPSMSPVFNSRQFEDVLLAFAKSLGKEFAAGAENYLTYLKAEWEKLYKEEFSSTAESFEAFWRASLDRGVVEASAKAAADVKTDDSVFKLDFKTSKIKGKKVAGESLVLFPYPSIKAFDGSLANRPWMQELPDPITQVAWDVWAEIHPETAKKIGLAQGDLVRVENYYGQLNVPAYLTPHVRKDIVAVPMGGGHKSYGRYAEQLKGGNVFDCLPQAADNLAGLTLLSTKVKLARGRGKHTLVNVQGSDSQMGRDLAQYKKVNLADHGKHDHHDGHHGHHEPKQVYEQREHPMHKWGMAIDLAACTGCSACVVACYAENNIPTVGKRVMNQGREMSWLRIERYFDQEAEELHVSFLPMMCQHCGNAPCEPVCPVYATYHNEEGLNAMIYNRCVGTRYCGNNCSYKVRRFNWFEFEYPEPLSWQLNPDVVKRTAGVMEKCTFCVQRIMEVKDLAKDDGRSVQDGEIKPACVQSCPTEAMVFGDLNDPNSKVSKLAKDMRAYKVLDHHLNTQPAVSYLTDVKFEV